MQTYALVENGVVSNVVMWDGDESTWRPDDGQTAVALKDGDSPFIGLGYVNGAFEQPPIPVAVPPNAAEVLAANTATKAQLLTNASVAIAPLQMAVSLGEATATETAQATAWVDYTRSVKAIDLTQPTPVWPTAPTA